MRMLNKLHVGLAISICLFLLLGYLIVKPKAEDKPPFLSFSADLDGVKAWRELLESKNSRVKEWRLDWSELPRGKNQLLTAVQPGTVTKEDVNHILEWVRQGNDLILLDQQPNEWSSYFPIVPLNGAHGQNSGNPSAADEARPIFREGDAKDKWTGVVQTGFRLKPSPDQHVLFSDGSGVLASQMAMGAGHLTMVLTPEWLTNERILANSHFELAWPLFDRPWSTVWLDETHHGYGTTRGLPAVYPAWIKLAALQLGLALLAWLWLRGKRFGPVYTPRAWTVRRGDETLLAVAGWYERLGFSREALSHQQQYLRQLLLARWGLSPSATAKQAADAARVRWPEVQAARLERLLEPPPALPGGVKPFVQRTREMGEMIAYLEKE
ncbi:DUF4350 domain-containing protein [Paenibacillus sp. GP183]|jgi:hypothetical protein|uniref:DUF4350 domain-containing protein n=1 Tax=Paenibacillus sp. GP183 TaxID=1882751 RepID=UPI000896835E|nr:DUF4350 domain-containing protein [Paenibacillus sp. GP183]SEC57435.1 protein of unknown function [Paenibacillus sp. GP183]